DLSEAASRIPQRPLRPTRSAILQVLHPARPKQERVPLLWYNPTRTTPISVRFPQTAKSVRYHRRLFLQMCLSRLSKRHSTVLLPPESFQTVYAVGHPILHRCAHLTLFSPDE